jgi:hypothetical protein
VLRRLTARHKDQDMSDPDARPETNRRPADARLPLARLYERFDAVATGRASADGVDLHGIILDRLQTNQAYAEAAGWTACVIERDGQSGRLRLVGIAPSASQRTIVPDWTAGVAADALARTGDGHRPVAAAAAAPRLPRIVRG